MLENIGEIPVDRGPNWGKFRIPIPCKCGHDKDAHFHCGVAECAHVDCKCRKFRLSKRYTGIAFV